jgi:cyclic beta-1,2-glucan synthetase
VDQRHRQSHFGFQVAADGGGFTWALNSREHQITPWSNDPVTDRPGEVLYLRDEENGEVWGPTAAPIRDPGATYSARHGQGYSRFEHRARTRACPLHVRTRWTIRSRSRAEDPQYLAAPAAAFRSRPTSNGCSALRGLPSAPFILTSSSTRHRRPVRAQSVGRCLRFSRVAFADLAGRQSQWTADRREFLGRHGMLEMPALYRHGRRSRRAPAPASIPCCALQSVVELASRTRRIEVVFFLGEAGDARAPRKLCCCATGRRSRCGIA